MPAPLPYDQLPLPLPPAVVGRPREGALASARVALATADRAALAAHLADVARLRGREPVPKPGTPRAIRRHLAPTSADLGAATAFRTFVRLISVDPTANRFRAYTLSWQPTLWGDYVLVQTWGRVGSPGRTRTTCYASRTAAQGAIARLLRRRLRHGYRVAAWV